MFEWQVGNTTRFIKIEVECSNGYNIPSTSNIVPASEYERFMEELKIWRDNR